MRSWSVLLSACSVFLWCCSYFINDLENKTAPAREFQMISTNWRNSVRNRIRFGWNQVEEMTFRDLCWTWGTRRFWEQDLWIQCCQDPVEKGESVSWEKSCCSVRGRQWKCLELWRAWLTWKGYRGEGGHKWQLLTISQHRKSLCRKGKSDFFGSRTRRNKLSLQQRGCLLSAITFSVQFLSLNWEIFMRL